VGNLIDTPETPRSGPICPVSGLAVTRRPEWTNVQLDDNYSVSVEVIGRHILNGIPNGYATKTGVTKLIELQQQVIGDVLEPGAPHIQISDYSGIKGATLDARRLFSDAISEREGLAALIFFNASPLLTLSIKLGRRFIGPRKPVEITSGYDKAILRALEILRDGGVKDLPILNEQPKTTIQPQSGILDLKDFHLTYRIIDGHIISSRAVGFLGLTQMERTVELENMLLASLDRSRGVPVAVVDATGVDRITAAARRRYIAMTRRRQNITPLGLMVCYGVNARNRATINISRPFLPYRIRVVQDEKAALEMARQTRSISTGSAGRIKSALFPGAKKPPPTNADHIDDLLRFMSTIEWETDKPGEIDWHHSPDHPLAPAIDALTLIRADVLELFRTRVKTEEALRSSEQRYRNILDSIVDGYYEIDLDGRLLFCNDALLRIFDYRNSEATDIDAKILMDESNLSLAIDTFTQVIHSGKPAHASDWEMLRKDGTAIQVEASISLVSDSDGRATGFRGIVRDISRRVRTAREKADLEVQLQRSQRMEAIGTLAGGIAHNFNNLLMGIQGNISLLMQEHDAGRPQTDRLETIEALVDGGSKLTSQLLGYARSGRVDVRIIDINSLVLETAETFSLTRREFRIHTALAECNLAIEVDPTQIEQALLNLLINAADAMRGGGDITITSCQVPHTELMILDDKITTGDHAVVSVSDTGCGMDQSTIEHIFEPFFTTKGLTGGTGLGLASTYGIIRAHGGLIDVESTVGEGSTFSFSFPLADGDVGRECETRESPVMGEGTILVVEDDEAVLEACSSMLSMLNYTPICVSSGRAAIDIFERRKDEIALVVLDLILADLSGAEVFDAIRSIDSDARVLLSSGYSIDGEAAGLLERGCDDFIQKPFTMQQLSQKIEGLLRRNCE